MRLEPQVSVIIPTFNRAPLIKEAIESVFSQTFTDYEIIIVDDGSTDNTHKLISDFSSNKIKYFYQPNKGRSAARNLGIREASGEFIAFLDSDDLFSPFKLEIQVNQMNLQTDRVWSHTSYKCIDSKGNTIKKVNSGCFSGRIFPDIYINCPIAVPTVMIRRNILLSNKLEFNESIDIVEDILLWIQIAKKYELVGIPETLSSVRLHGKNASTDIGSQITSIETIIQYIKTDREISRKKKNEFVSILFYVEGRLFYRNRDIKNSIIYFCKSFLNDPKYIIKRNFKFGLGMVLKIMPVSWEKRLKKLRVDNSK